MQSAKADSPIVLTDSPIVTEVNPVQFVNARYSIVVTESGITNEVSAVQEPKA